MTDAREIIADAINSLPDDYSDFPPSEVIANKIANALNIAGFRILGPDEVDPVTVEKAAEAAENASMRVSYGILSQERDEPILHRTAIASLIRALGRKV